MSGSSLMPPMISSAAEDVIDNISGGIFDVKAGKPCLRVDT
jgi:hypothetical protein